MKTNMYVFVACLATLFFASCSKETTDPEPQPGEKTARLELTLEGTKTVNGRATGGTLPTSEGNIKTIAIGVFNSDKTVNVIAEPTVVQSGGVLAGINCMPGTVDIIVVANAPAGTFAGVMTKDAFIAKTVALSVTQTSNVQTSDNLPMSGEATGVALTAGSNKAQTISLSRLVARISISSIQTAFDQNGAYKNATFKVDKVFLYNAMSTSTVIPTTQPTGTAPIHGATAPNGAYAAGTAWLLDVITPVDVKTAYTTPHWFYTFANDGKSAPTKFVISGQFDADGAGSDTAEAVYYPIVVNKQQTGTIITGGGGDSTIKRNSEYKLSATIKSKGVSDPAENIDPATLTLTVEVAPWALTITQDVTFD